MPGIKVSELTTATTLTNGDFMYFVQSGQSRKADIATMRSHAGVFNVQAFGANPNGTTDSTAAIQSAITAAAGKTLYFPPGNYRTSSLNITSPITIFGENATLNSGTSHVIILNVTSSNVFIRDLNFIGAGNASYSNNGRMINVSGVVGASTGIAPTYISNIVVENCRFSSAGRTAVFASYVDGITVRGNRITNMGYAGTEFQSCNHARFVENIVSGVSPGTGGGSSEYGVYWSSVNSSDLVRYPTCMYAVCANNFFENIEWEGIDCHGIEGFVVEGNYLKNCGTRNASIALIHGDNESALAVRGNLNVRVVGNTVIGGSLGIALSNTNNSVVHENVTITGNTVQDVGDPAVALLTTGNVRYRGGIRLASVINATVSGNVVKRSAQFGVILDDDKCDGISITGNTFSQMYSNVVTGPSAIFVARDGGTGSVDISGNTLTNVTGLGTYSNVYGVWAYTTDGGNINIGRNNFKSASIPYAGQLAFYNGSAPVVSNHGSYIFTTTTSVNMLSVDITLSNEFSGNTTYVPTADIFQMSGAIQPCVLEIQRLSNTQVQIRLKTANGANFAAAGSVSIYWQAIGF